MCYALAFRLALAPSPFPRIFLKYYVRWVPDTSAPDPPARHLVYCRLLMVCACVALAHAGEDASTTAAVLQGARSVYKTYKQCEAQASVVGCLKLRALRLIERAIYLENIPVADGVSLVSRPDTQRSLNDIPVDENSLPQEVDLRDKRIDSLLWEKIGTFFQTHSVQLQVPKLVEESKALLENEIDDEEQEGRGKKKKYAGPLLVGLMMKGFMVALAYKALALLAGKALIVSKLALVLAGIVALKKLFSGGEQKTTYEIVKQPVVSHAHQYTSSHEFAGGHGGDWASSGSGGYGRSLEAQTQAQAQERMDLAPAVHGRAMGDTVPYPHLMAYRAQLPKYLQQTQTAQGDLHIMIRMVLNSKYHSLLLGKDGVGDVEQVGAGATRMRLVLADTWACVVSHAYSVCAEPPASLIVLLNGGAKSMPSSSHHRVCHCSRISLPIIIDSSFLPPGRRVNTSSISLTYLPRNLRKREFSLETIYVKLSFPPNIVKITRPSLTMPGKSLKGTRLSLISPYILFITGMCSETTNFNSSFVRV
ncbi:hypothetical protein J6590_000955 [Homalodisca vitripennis]|nr:hypothetical protein J6590_000955 [Homalodisca vitripennis]